MGDHEYLKSYISTDEQKEPAGESTEEKAVDNAEPEAKSISLDQESQAKVEDKATGKKQKSSRIGVPHVKLPDLTRIPHPKGSIGLILLMILLLLFAVVPAPSGGSRLQLLMGAILGRVKVGGTAADTGKPTNQNAVSSAGQSDTTGQATYDTGSVLVINGAGVAR